MVPGIWLEPEVMGVNCPLVEEFRDCFFMRHGRPVITRGRYQLDFRHPKVIAHLNGVVDRLTRDYGIGYFKFDYNIEPGVGTETGADSFGDGLLSHNRAFLDWIDSLYARHPGLQIENCASGGMRMHLANCKEFDSFWHSDCQSAHEGMRLFKDAVLRLPPQVFDRWTVIESVKNVLVNAGGEPHNHIISTSDAVWQQIEGVQMSHLKGFLSGGPLGFSCDLSALSKLHFEELKKHIAQFKQERDFWATAECRITVDTESLFILEFRNRDLSKVVTQIYIRHVMQKGMFLYPQLDPAKTYRIDGGETVKGSTLMEEGYYKPFTHFSNMTMEQVTYTAAE